MQRYGYQFSPRVANVGAEEMLIEASAVAQLPQSVSLRQQCTPVRDQGSLGACTGFALCACLEMGGSTITSPLFVYFRERLLENDVQTDQGASLASGVQVVFATGVCLETLWPYVQSQFTASPPPEAYSDAAKRRSPSQAITIAPNVTAIKLQLARGVPVVIGICAFTSFEGVQTQQTGIVPIPDTTTESSLGGHALCLVGYDDATQLFLAKNSWGTSWGDAGYLHLPYDYVLDPNLTSEIFAVTPLISGGAQSPQSPPQPQQQQSTWSQMSSTQKGLFIAAMTLLGLLLVFALVMVGLSARNHGPKSW